MSIATQRIRFFLCFLAAGLSLTGCRRTLYVPQKPAGTAEFAPANHRLNVEKITAVDKSDGAAPPIRAEKSNRPEAPARKAAKSRVKAARAPVSALEDAATRREAASRIDEEIPEKAPAEAGDEENLVFPESGSGAEDTSKAEDRSAGEEDTDAEDYLDDDAEENALQPDPAGSAGPAALPSPGGIAGNTGGKREARRKVAEKRRVAGKEVVAVPSHKPGDRSVPAPAVSKAGKKPRAGAAPAGKLSDGTSFEGLGRDADGDKPKSFAGDVNSERPESLGSEQFPGSGEPPRLEAGGASGNALKETSPAASTGSDAVGGAEAGVAEMAGISGVASSAGMAAVPDGGMAAAPDANMGNMKLDLNMSINMDAPEPILANIFDEFTCTRLSRAQIQTVREVAKLLARQVAYELKSGQLDHQDFKKDPWRGIKDPKLRKFYLAETKKRYRAAVEPAALVRSEEQSLERLMPMLISYPCRP